MAQTVMASVALLMGEEQSWRSVQKMLANPKAFVTRLQSYPKDNMSADTLKKLRQYTRQPEFTVEVIMKQSSAAADCAKWVIDIDAYNTQIGK